MGIRKRIEAKVNRLVGQASDTLTNADTHMESVAVAMLEVLEEGVELELQVAGRNFPVKLRLRPNVSEREEE